VLARCRQGDPGAFRAFVAYYERLVFMVISRLAGRGPHVEDLSQETFLRAARALRSFDPQGPAKPSSWLLTIATRLTLDARRRRRVPLEPFTDTEEFAAPGTPETERSHRELGRAIERAAAALPDDQRAVFVLAELHGLTMSEIAGTLETPEATVKTRLFRARERLRAALAPYWKDAKEP
jgi:RNA polymerase sigma-70 factor (ECF subfamily)